MNITTRIVDTWKINFVVIQFICIRFELVFELNE